MQTPHSKVPISLAVNFSPVESMSVLCRENIHRSEYKSRDSLPARPALTLKGQAKPARTKLAEVIPQISSARSRYCETFEAFFDHDDDKTTLTSLPPPFSPSFDRELQTKVAIMGGVTVRDVDVRIPYIFFLIPSKKSVIYRTNFNGSGPLSLSLPIVSSVKCAKEKKLQATGYLNFQQYWHALGMS